jgi:hypothetical protein
MTSPKRQQRYVAPARENGSSRPTVRLVTAQAEGAAPAGPENLVAWDLGGGNFVIRSVPVIATHLAHGDIVSCVEHDGTPVVGDVVVSGGGVTLRLLVDDDRAADRPGLRELIAKQLVSSGCAVERMGNHVLAVGVGPDVDRGDIGTLCDAWEDAGVVRVLP